jgi:hypothetical protein
MDEDLMPEPGADLAVRTLRFLDQDGATQAGSVADPPLHELTAFVESRLDQLTSAALLG